MGEAGARVRKGLYASVTGQLRVWLTSRRGLPLRVWRSSGAPTDSELPPGRKSMLLRLRLSSAHDQPPFMVALIRFLLPWLAASSPVSVRCGAEVGCRDGAGAWRWVLGHQ